MIVTGIGRSVTVTQPRAKSREEKQAERQRTRFSSRHIILDLSLEAWKQVGHEPHSSARTLLPPLFIYNDSGDFAYNDAARRYEEAQQRAISRMKSERLLVNADATAVKPVIATAPMPSVVAFDSMLGGGVGQRSALRSGFLQARHQFNEIARCEPIVELMDENFVPRVLAGPRRSRHDE